jgi:quinohemoprotein ethanol dehydrogenase
LPAPHIVTPIKDASFLIDASFAQLGAALYGYCGHCHGSGAVAGGMAPDLRASAIPLDQDAFVSVVRDGARSARAMPAFPHLTDEQLTALRHFIRQQAMASGSIAVTPGGQ